MKIRLLILILSLILISSSESLDEVVQIEKLKSAFVTNASVPSIGSDNDLIVTTQYAGILRSTNQGNSFSKLDVGLSGQSKLLENNFYSIYVDGQNIYAGGGSFNFVQGAGFHVSTDGGASFTLRGLKGRNINAIKQYLDKMLLGTQGQGVQSYENEMIMPFNTDMETAIVYDLFFDEGSTGNLFAGTAQDLKWYNITNETWEPTGFNQSVSNIEKGDGDIAYLASSDEIYETAGFENFDLLPQLNLPDFYNFQTLAYHNPYLYAGVAPVNFENDMSLVHRYNTNTSTWEDNTAGLPKNIGIPLKFEIIGNNKFLMTSNAFYRGSINGPWDDSDYGPSAALITKVDYNSFNNHYYAGGAGDLYITDNIGGEWIKNDWGLKVGVQINDFAFTPNGTFVVHFGSLRYQENIDDKFEERQDGITASLFNEIAFNPLNNRTVVTTNDGIFYSTNYGANWQLTNKSEIVYEIEYSETHDKFFAANFNGLFSSDGDGEDFTDFLVNVLALDIALKDDLLDLKIGVASIGSFYEIDEFGNSTELGVLGLPGGATIKNVSYDPTLDTWLGNSDNKIYYYDYNQGIWVDAVEIDKIITDIFNGVITGGSKANDNGTILISTLGGGLYTDADLTDVHDSESQFVKHFTLKQNYPNPFNPTTKISYSITEASFVTLKIYDLLGKEITTLINEEKSAGSYKINFDADRLSSGIYFYKIEAGNFIETKKMMLLK